MDLAVFWLAVRNSTLFSTVSRICRLKVKRLGGLQKSAKWMLASATSPSLEASTSSGPRFRDLYHGEKQENPVRAVIARVR